MIMESVIRPTAHWIAPPVAMPMGMGFYLMLVGLVLVLGIILCELLRGRV
jgi:hypothetical protein